jgi:hypothetical protein
MLRTDQQATPGKLNAGEEHVANFAEDRQTKSRRHPKKPRTFANQPTKSRTP